VAIVLHPTTQAHIQRFVSAPGHALLLSGPAGSGKTFVAQQLAAQLLGIAPEKLDSYPYAQHVTPVKQTISIEAVRTLQHFLELKTIGDRPIRRIVIIEHAHTLSTEAQNALLKTLEEPPEDTVIILTAHNPRALLTTIRSRLQEIVIHPPESEQLAAHFSPKAASPQAYVSQAMLSGGLPGLLDALLSEAKDHPLAVGIDQAKLLLKADTFERLAQIDALAKQKDSAITLCSALIRIAQAGLEQAAKKNTTPQLRNWQRILKTAYQAQTDLESNLNAKLTLTHMMLSLES